MLLRIIECFEYTQAKEKSNSHSIDILLKTRKKKEKRLTSVSSFNVQTYIFFLIRTVLWQLHIYKYGKEHMNK